MRLQGKVAIVTGGGTGIGAGVSKRLAKEGARLVIVGVDFLASACNQYQTKNIGGYTAAKELAQSLSKEGVSAIAIGADVTNKAQVESMVNKAVAHFGRVDLLVHCAGVITFRNVADLTEEDWDSIMITNAKGTFLVNQAVAAQMKKQGGGKIINFSSLAGKVGYPGLAHYCASKFAIHGFTQALAKELTRDHITVNIICPGIVGTQMWKLLAQGRALPGESEEQSFQRNAAARIPQGEPQTEEDMAEGVVFLAVSDHVTGQAITIDGGATM
ncbi:MAG: SDR family NAD(P)-dependent oxidoreductase [Terriglobia bacterium]|jgi:meso-butanediol dehydrogenase/(S,S)-butanediol dehydrogenase/diacetyl reductase